MQVVSGGHCEALLDGILHSLQTHSQMCKEGPDLVFMFQSN